MMQKHTPIKVRVIDLFSGVALMNLGKFEEAIIMYDRALKINPNDAKTYLNKGHRYFLFIRKYIDQIEKIQCCIIL